MKKLKTSGYKYEEELKKVFDSSKMNLYYLFDSLSMNHWVNFDFESKKILINDSVLDQYYDFYWDEENNFNVVQNEILESFLININTRTETLEVLDTIFKSYLIDLDDSINIKNYKYINMERFFKHVEETIEVIEDLNTNSSGVFKSRLIIHIFEALQKNAYNFFYTYRKNTNIQKIIKNKFIETFIILTGMVYENPFLNVKENYVPFFFNPELEGKIKMKKNGIKSSDIFNLKFMNKFTHMTISVMYQSHMYTNRTQQESVKEFKRRIINTTFNFNDKEDIINKIKDEDMDKQRLYFEYLINFERKMGLSNDEKENKGVYMKTSKDIYCHILAFIKYITHFNQYTNLNVMMHEKNNYDKKLLDLELNSIEGIIKDLNDIFKESEVKNVIQYYNPTLQTESLMDIVHLDPYNEKYKGIIKELTKYVEENLDKITEILEILAILPYEYNDLTWFDVLVKIKDLFKKDPPNHLAYFKSMIVDNITSWELIIQSELGFEIKQEEGIMFKFSISSFINKIKDFFVSDKVKDDASTEKIKEIATEYVNDIVRFYKILENTKGKNKNIPSLMKEKIENSTDTYLMLKKIKNIFYDETSLERKKWYMELNNYFYDKSKSNKKEVNFDTKKISNSQKKFKIFFEKYQQFFYFLLNKCLMNENTKLNLSDLIYDKSLSMRKII